LKVKLFVLAALILLSSINSIFNSIPIIGVSAQEYEEIDYGSTGTNEMVENYLYEEPSTYNTDNGYSNEEAEYSSYDNYEYSPNNEYVQDDYSSYNPSSYGNEYSENSYDESYYPPKEPKKFTCPDSGIVVDKQENCPIVCPAGSALEGHFVKAGSDLQKVCNEEELQTCGTGTDLEGVKVSNAAEDCDLFFECTANTPLGRSLDLPTGGSVEVADPQLCQLTVGGQISTTTCPETSTNPIMRGEEVFDEELCNAATPAVQCTDGTFQGVWVHPDQETEICDLTIPQFAQCDADSSLAQSLGLGPTDPPLQVADIRLCDLVVPEFATCDATTPLGQFFGQSVQVADEQLCNLVTQCGTDTNMAGAFVTDEDLCAAPDDDNLCTSGDLVGVYVNNPATDCELDIPPPVQTFTCAGVPGSNLPPDAVVTDQRLCTAAIPALQCAPGSDLAGVWVNSTATGIAQCNISPADITLERNPQAQCLKCADLTAVQSGSGQSAAIANALIGTTTNNVFSVCDDTDPRPGFDALLIAGGFTNVNQRGPINTTFDRCLDNAAVTPGTEPRAGTPAPPPVTTAPVPTALQENSLTTNIQSEAEIPTESEISTFSPPTIAQGVEGAENSSPTLAKMEKLKQQWLDLLP
jgi:hypothetical protein